MKKRKNNNNCQYIEWLEPFEPVPSDIRTDEPAIQAESLKKHFNESQVEFIKRRVALQCPDLRNMSPDHLPEHFARNGGVNDSKLILTFLVQYFIRFLEKKDGPVRGNLKSFWYRVLSGVLERLGRLETLGGLSVSNASARERYLLKTMEDSFEQLFLKEFFHYRDLDVYNQRESFRLMGREKKRHLFYTEKEGFMWFCRAVHAIHSCHTFASRGSSSWLDIDYLAEAIQKLAVRSLYVAALTDYDPWGLFIAKQIRRKLESHRFGFRKIHLEVLTDLSLFDPEAIKEEKRYLLTGHEDPKDPVHKVVMQWVNNGGGINGEPYGLYVDHVNQERATKRVDSWIKGKWVNRLSSLEFPEDLMKAALRQMRTKKS